MIDAINDFKKTKLEINKYFDFLKTVNDLSIGIPHIHYPIAPSIPSYKIDEDVSKILKANAFLMLYNLVEATIKNKGKRAKITIVLFLIGIIDFSLKVLKMR
jgi:hypothetical protein